MDCAKHFSEKYQDIVSNREIRLYTDAFIAANAEFCHFRWEQYYFDKGVSESEYEIYYRGEGVFDWDTYYEQKDAIVLTYKDFFLQENSDLNITNLEYDLYTQGLNFDWAGFWDSRVPEAEISIEQEQLFTEVVEEKTPDVSQLDMDQYDFIEQL